MIVNDYEIDISLNDDRDEFRGQLDFKKSLAIEVLNLLLNDKTSYMPYETYGLNLKSIEFDRILPGSLSKLSSKIDEIIKNYFVKIINNVVTVVSLKEDGIRGKSLDIEINLSFFNYETNQEEYLNFEYILNKTLNNKTKCKIYI